MVHSKRDNNAHTARKQANNHAESSSQVSARKNQLELVVLKIDESGNGDKGDDEAQTSDVDFQNDLFERLRASRLHPKWITAEECLEKTCKGNEVFILLHFNGPVFEHLQSLKCRIYGSLAALTCLLNEQRLPKWTHPILSMTLRDCVICFTGIDKEIRVIFY
ncbi:unnamed protein product [Anisakis simplex]|uniref:Dynein light chain n=1 Tax=Anisakis simplex TaxID=6269 RepID=A0A0M3KHB7_ANISI|nr:unnamed protein product [Anisakis simplex]